MGSTVPLGIIPLGTANVLARELRLSFVPRVIGETLAFGRTRPLWPGLATGPDGARVFVQMLGAGFDARVVHNLPPRLKRYLGRGAYAIQTLREMRDYDFRPIRLRIDGTETEAAAAIVSKGRLYAGPYLLAPEARPNEPGFSVVLFERGGACSAMRYGSGLLTGMLPRMAGVRHIRARRIEFLGNEPVPVQTDGDRNGFTPLTVLDAPAPIQIVVAG